MATMAPRHLARYPLHGKHKPPFKAGTPEYARWYAQVQRQFKQSGSTLHRHEFYAQAKAEAASNPPPKPIPLKPDKPKLFGGALTPKYRAWYYRMHRACKSLPTHEQNWPEFFKAARLEEERRQGFIPSNVVPFNPSPPVSDGRLMFDFTVAPPHHLVTD